MALIPTPPILDWIPYFDLRERIERRIDKDFDSSRSDDRTDLFSRWRVGVSGSDGKRLRVQLELQYAHDAIWTSARNHSTENGDLSLGFIEMKNGRWTIDAGRQRINLGQQRLVGSAEWTNVGRTFDGVRIRSRRWDLFAGKVGLQAPYPPHARLVTVQHIDPRYGSTLYVFKHDTGTDVHTLDHSLVRSLGRVTLDTEVALQGGRTAGKDLRAWAVHARLASVLPHGFMPFVEANAASGGRDAKEVRTFDNLYPTNHGKFGIADMAGWRNMNHVGLGVDYLATPRLGLRASGHFLWLRDPGDKWYGASGAPIATPAPGGGAELGAELDLEANYKSGPATSWSAGLALFNPGRAVRKLTGRCDKQSFGYLQLSMKF